MQLLPGGGCSKPPAARFARTGAIRSELPTPVLVPRALTDHPRVADDAIATAVAALVHEHPELTASVVKGSKIAGKFRTWSVLSLP